MAVSPRALIEKLNSTCRTTLVDEAIRLCMTRTHFHVEIEHWLVALLGNPNNDLGFLLRQYAIDANRVKRELEQPRPRQVQDRQHPRKPGFSTDILDAIREVWRASVRLELGCTGQRSAHLLYAILTDRNLSGRIKDTAPELGRISVEKLASDIRDLLPNVQSEEAAQEASAAAVASATGGEVRQRAGGTSASAGRRPRSISSR